MEPGLQLLSPGLRAQARGRFVGYPIVVIQRFPMLGEGNGEEKVRAEDQKWKPEAQ